VSCIPIRLITLCSAIAHTDTDRHTHRPNREARIYVGVLLLAFYLEHRAFATRETVTERVKERDKQRQTETGKAHIGTYMAHIWHM